MPELARRASRSASRSGPDGNVYVPDTHYHRVVVYSPDGKELRRWGERGTEPGQFIWPTDVAFDEAGNVYVTEYGDNDRVQVFAPDGTFLRTFGQFGDGDGRVRPAAVDGDRRRPRLRHRCVQPPHRRLQDRRHLRPQHGLASAPASGEFRFPFGLDLDREGRLVVCEFGNNRVQLVDKDTGKGLGIWGAGGRDPGQLAYPWAVALDKPDRVVAVDSGNNRLQVFEF